MGGCCLPLAVRSGMPLSTFPYPGQLSTIKTCLAQMSVGPRLRNPNKYKGPGKQSVIKIVIMEKGAEKGVQLSVFNKPYYY